MRKKLALLVAVLIFFIGLTSCGGKPQSGALRDGRYEAHWQGGDENGYSEYIVVEVKRGVPSVVEMDAKDENGYTKTTDDRLNSTMLSANETKGLPAIESKAAYTAILTAFSTAGGQPTAMEYIAGATRSTQSFKLLYAALLPQMQEGNQAPLAVPYYADGVYKVYYPTYDMWGYREMLELVVEGGTPTVTGADATYFTGEFKSTSDLTPTVPFTDTYTSLISSANNSSHTPMQADLVVGATMSSEKFNELLAAALQAAHLRTTKEFILPLYRDGEYTAEFSSVDEYGYKDFLTLRITSGNVRVVVYDAVNEAGTLKSADSSLSAQYRAEHPTGKSPSEAGSDIIKAFYNGGQSVLDMDNIAGATISTNNFKVLAGQLLAYNAPNGNHLLLIVERPDPQPVPPS